MGTKYPELFQALLEPFDASEVRTKPGPKGHPIQYVTARVVMNRLDEVLGPENWSDSYTCVTDHSALCSLTIRLPDGTELTKCDAGGAAGMQDPGDDDKSIISDAFKRAAVKFGVGRYLYREGVTGEHAQAPAREQQPKRPEPRKDSGRQEVPRTGKELFARLKDLEQEHRTELIYPLNETVKQFGFPSKMTEWNADQIRRSWEWACKKLSAQKPANVKAQPSGNDLRLGDLRHELLSLARENMATLFGEQFGTMTEDQRKEVVKEEINSYLGRLSPGEVVDSLNDLNDEGQLREMIRIGQRMLVSRRQAQGEGETMGM